MKNALIFISFATIMFSCNDQDNTATTTKEDSTITEKKAATDDDAASTTNAQLLNGITVATKGGVKVDRAFLAFASGELVPADNKAAYEQKVKLNLNLDGWAEQDGKVFIGASEKVVSADGDIILDAPDLFEMNTDGLNAADAKFIKLSTTVTKTNKPSAYYTVSFRVWNKKGEGEVTGSYKLYVE